MTLILIWPVWYGCGLQHLIPDVFVTQDAVLVEMHMQSLLVYVLAKDSGAIRAGHWCEESSHGGDGKGSAG